MISPELVTAVILGLILIILVVYLWTKYWRTYSLGRKFAGPPALPLIGCAHLLFGKSPEDVLRTLMEWAATYGKTYRIWFGSQLNVTLHELADIEKVLSSNSILKKAGHYQKVGNWLGNGLLLSGGLRWQQRRKMLTPAFHFKILEDIIPIMKRHSLVLIQKMRMISTSSSGRVNFSEIISLCTLDIICESAMGISLDAQINARSEYGRAVHKMSAVVNKRFFKAIHYFDIINQFTNLPREEKNALKVLHSFTDKVIMQRREELLKRQQVAAPTEAGNDEDEDEDNDIGAKPKMAFLDILLQSEINGKPLSNLDIREEVDTFMFEGHDTTGSALMFFFYNMAMNPESQEKCYEELRRVFGEQKSPTLTIEQINQLHYLELCIKESLRMFPPVPLFGRELMEEADINGKKIPKGAIIGISPLYLGQCEDLFNEPLKFRPERFATTNGDRREIKTFSHIPFSAGPRNCIGQKFAMLELKTVTSYILLNFQVEYGGDPNVKFLPVFQLTLKSNIPLILKIKPRL